jgi:hypothetical protein
VHSERQKEENESERNLRKEERQYKGDNVRETGSNRWSSGFHEADALEARRTSTDADA